MASWMGRWMMVEDVGWGTMTMMTAAEA